MILTIIISSVVFFGVYFLYLYFQKCYQFWQNIKVPCLEPSFPFGNVPEQLTMQKHFGCLMQNLYEKTKILGDYVGFYCITDPVLMVLSPEFAKTVLVKDFNYFIDRGVYCHPTKDAMAKTLFFLENDEWRDLRSKLVASFSSSKLKVMLQTMIYKSGELFEQLKLQLKKNDIINIRDILERYMIDVTSSYAFGIESNSMTDKESSFRTMSLKMVDFPYFHSLRLYFSLLFKKTAKYLQLQFHNNDVNAYFFGVVKKSLEHRQKTGEQYNDYLQILIDLGTQTLSKEEPKEQINKMKLTFPEIAAQSFVFQFSTLQTSTNIAAIAMYLLAINLNEQKKAREDVMGAIKSHGNDISYETLMEMNYLDNVLNETLRLYPPVATIHRQSAADYKLPNGSIMPAGTRLLIPVLGFHRDADIFPDPMKFDPNRFSETEKSKRNSFYFLPFGEGPRGCIAMRYGFLQTKLVLALLLHKYQFNVCDKTVIPLEVNSLGLVHVPKGPIWLKLTEAIIK